MILDVLVPLLLVHSRGSRGGRRGGGHDDDGVWVLLIGPAVLLALGSAWRPLSILVGLRVRGGISRVKGDGGVPSPQPKCPTPAVEATRIAKRAPTLLNGERPCVFEK